MERWHASLTFTVQHAYDSDTAFDLIDSLDDSGAAMSIANDYKGGSVTLTIESDTAVAAANAATNNLLEHAPASIGVIEITGIEILSEEAMDAYLDEPVFPEVVGYAEIAELGGFSRQRARQLADSEAFPPAVITTAQGPLYSKHAIDRWLESRNTKPGRPAKAHA